MLLFLVTLGRVGRAEASRAEDFATSSALDTDWFRAFRSTFNNSPPLPQHVTPTVYLTCVRGAVCLVQCNGARIRPCPAHASVVTSCVADAAASPCASPGRGSQRQRRQR